MGGRKIWFSRWLWSYMPCNLTGWLVLLGFILGINLAIQGLLWLISATGHPEWDMVPFAPLPVGVVWLLIVAERHSPPKD